MTQVPDIKLHGGSRLPKIGLGTSKLEDPRVRIREALEVGYRHIDTASRYDNETEVGLGIKDFAVDRSELFITTKLRGYDQGFDNAKRALDDSLQRLGLEYVDLFLIHWPLPRLDKYVESWRAMEEMLAVGKTKAVGVSNFLPTHLERLAAETSLVPAVNQIQLNPLFSQRDLVDYHADHGIVTEAWSPLGKGQLLGNPALDEIAAKHGKSAAQVILRWHLDQDIVVIPKASHRDRMQQNLDVFDFSLDSDDTAVINALNTGKGREGFDPAIHEEF
ncbi:aldo/keto reductase [Saxibacter everestensis]|uniref:Aldo/keto reductase n=1 Tax=Saxibacter everestensis TaxID=2909229 RepID=A0ABY8QZX0_9MICO|nr:aldo/keto reductase [Brevibacteriaceae bacterium ZFBP1038]